MKRKAVCLPNYIIGPDAYIRAGAVLRDYGKKAVIVGGQKAMAAAADKLERELLAAGIQLTGRVWYGGGRATYECVHDLSQREEIQAADMILAMGGGTVCDNCKVLAEAVHKPLFTFPTLASNCSPCTALAIMYHEDGSMKGNYYSELPPRYTFIDTEVVVHAPLEYLRAGIGDALSKEPEVLLALRYVELDQNLLLGKAMAAACTEPLLQYGEAAMAAAERGEVTPAFEEVVLDIIITTGLVSNMTVCPEFYYNTNLAHCFYYGATVLPVYHDFAHGVWVSYGVLVLLEYDGQTELRDRILRLNRKLGLPVTLAEFGITMETLPALAQKAISVPGWYVEGYPLDSEKFLDAILKVDELGKGLN